MAIVIPHTDTLDLVLYLVGQLGPVDLRVGLFTNNITPNDTTQLSDLSQPTDSAYSLLVIPHADWSSLLVSGVIAARAGVYSWSFTTDFNVYGYFITDPTGTKLLWLERLPSPPRSVLGIAGLTTIQPGIRLVSEV